MNKFDLCTPSAIVDEDRLRANIAEFQAACDRRGKRLTPMTKTHKSSFVAKLQLEAGAAGLLCGTIREAELFSPLRPGGITFAYPFIGASNLARMLSVGRQVPVTVSLDLVETALQYDEFLRASGAFWDYLLIVDTGLHRFGVEPAHAGETVAMIERMCKRLCFAGISSHPGQVYGATTKEQIAAYCNEELSALREAYASLAALGTPCPTVASGSTPTFYSEVESDIVNVVRPGNYAYFDAIQTMLGADENRCAFRVLASIIGKRGERRFLIDAGSKCLGLDRGAHGNGGLAGYGRVPGLDGAVIVSLSEEVGILEGEKPLPLKIGDRIEIIPNHSCSAANMTDHVVLVRGQPGDGAL